MIVSSNWPPFRRSLPPYILPSIHFKSPKREGEREKRLYVDALSWLPAQPIVVWSIAEEADKRCAQSIRQLRQKNLICRKVNSDNYRMSPPNPWETIMASMAKRMCLLRFVGFILDNLTFSIPRFCLVFHPGACIIRVLERENRKKCPLSWQVYHSWICKSNYNTHIVFLNRKVKLDREIILGQTECF